MESLEFTMNLTDKPVNALKVGSLTYNGHFGTHTYTVTTGLSGIQYKGSQKVKGRGVIPDCKSVGIQNYTVSTNKLWLPHIKGVEGSFFPIAPFEVLINGVRRGDFGIHFDANMPGSAGCVVLRTQYGWTKFLELMNNLKTIGVKAISLEVNYS